MILWILNINNLTNLNGFKCIEKINITIELNIVRIVIKRKFENLIYSKEINLIFSCVFLKNIVRFTTNWCYCFDISTKFYYNYIEDICCFI